MWLGEHGRAKVPIKSLILSDKCLPLPADQLATASQRSTVASDAITQGRAACQATWYHLSAQKSGPARKALTALCLQSFNALLTQGREFVTQHLNLPPMLVRFGWLELCCRMWQFLKKQNKRRESP
jgi:hypothetical protein